MSTKPELKCVASNAAPGQVTFSNALKVVEQTLLRDLAELTTQMFDKADDVFFEFAEKVKTDSERNRYFDSMRELRLQRKTIESTFLATVQRGFDELGQARAQAAADSWSTSTLESLSLVNNEELEQKVALEGMIAKARNRHQSGLRQLTARLDVLVSGVTVTEMNSPADPRQLGESFRAAVKCLQCDIKSLLIVYKLFERSMLEKLDKPLQDCNFLLAKAGVLPDLKDTPVAPQRRPGAERPAVSAVPRNATGRDALPQDITGYLRSLMDTVRVSPLSGAQGFNAGPIGSDLPMAREVPMGDLLGMLSDLQSVMPAGQDMMAGLTGDARVDVRSTLESVFARRAAANGPERVSQHDTDVINLVGFLFDFILDDRNLPVRVKALLGRLQIPLLKVAVKDPAFFSSGGHPARRLLNELAHAGIGLPDDDALLEKDGMFQQIREAVQTILDKFKDDVGLFEQLLAQFQEYLGSETRRAELIEQRTRSAEEGKALADQARQAVAHVLARKLEGRVIPVIVREFMDDAWSNVMFRAYVRQGESGKPWVAALQTIDLLVQSITPAPSAAERQALANGLPVLQKRLRDGLESISWNVLQGNEFIARIEEIQNQVLHGETPAYLRVSPVSPEVTDQLLNAIREDAGVAAVDAGASAADAAPVVSPAPAATSARGAVRSDLMAPVIRRAAPKAAEPTAKEPELPALAEDDEHLVKARSLGVGTWVEQVDEHGGKIRCKLAARIKINDRVVFVNRSGIKVRDCSTLALAHDLIACRVIILDDSLLFDRALQSVIGNLRKVREGALAGA